MNENEIAGNLGGTGRGARRLIEGSRFEAVPSAEGRSRSGLLLLIDPPGDYPEVKYLPDGPGGRRLLVWSSHTISLRDAETGEPVWEAMRRGLHTEEVEFLPETKGGPRILSWSPRSYGSDIRLWDAATGEPVCGPLEHRELRGVLYLPGTPGGSRLLSWSRDGTLLLWDAATGQRVGEPMKHANRVDGALYFAAAPRGPRILSWAGDNTLQLWDAASGEPVGAPMRHDGEISGARGWHDAPGEPRILSWSKDDETIRMWDAATGAPLGKYMRHPQIRSVVYLPNAPDRPRLASWPHSFGGGSDRSVRLWDAATGDPVGEPMRHEHDPRPFEYLPNAPGGPRLLSVDWGHSIRVWDAADGLPVGEPMPHDGLLGAEYVPDAPSGPCILSWSQRDNTVRLWDASTHRSKLVPMQHESTRAAVRDLKDRVEGASYLRDAPGGPRILSWSWDGTVRLWDASDGTPVGDPMEHKAQVTGALYVPDAPAGPSLLSWSEKDATVRLWDAARAKPVREPMRHDGVVRGVQCISDASGAPLILSRDDGTVRLWDTKTTAAAGSIGHELPVQELQYLPDASGGSCLLSWDLETVRLWDAATTAPVGEPMRYWNAHPEDRVEGRVDYLRHTRSGPRILVSSNLDSSNRARTVQLWDGATTKRLGEPIPHQHAVCIPDDRDGVRIVTWSSQGDTIGLWSAASGERVGREMRHEGKVAGARSLPDAPGGRRILSWSWDGTARLWDSATGEPVGDPMRHHRISGARYLPHSQRILSWSQDNVIRYWDAARGTPIGDPVELKPEGRDRRLTRVEYLPDTPRGPRIVTWIEPWMVRTERTRSGWSEVPGEIRVRDAATGEPVGKINEYVSPTTKPVRPTSLTYLPDTPNGPQILAWDERSIELWDAATGETCGKKMWHSGYISYARYVPDASGGPRILSCSGSSCGWGGDDNTVRLWDATTGEAACEPMRHDDKVRGCRYLRDVFGGPHILSWSKRSLHVWSALTFREVVPPTRVDNTVAGAPILVDGDAAVTARLIVCTDRPQLFVLA